MSYSNMERGLRSIEGNQGIQAPVTRDVPPWQGIEELDTESSRYYANLSPEQKELNDMYEQRDMFEAELQDKLERPVVRPPRVKLAPGDKPKEGDWTFPFSDEQLIAIARVNGRNPYREDWWDAMDLDVINSEYFTYEIRTVQPYLNRKTGNWVRGYQQRRRVPASVESILKGSREFIGGDADVGRMTGDLSSRGRQGEEGIPLSSIPRSEEDIRDDLRAAVLRARELEGEGVSMPPLETRGPRPYGGTGQQEGLIPGDQPGPAMGPRPYTGTGTQEGLLSEAEMLRAEPPPTGAPGPDYPLGGERQDPLMGGREDIPGETRGPLYPADVPGQEATLFRGDQPQGARSLTNPTGWDVTPTQRGWEEMGVRDVPMDPRSQLMRRATGALRGRLEEQPEWQAFNASRQGTEDFHSWRTRKNREMEFSEMVDRQTRGTGGTGGTGGRGVGFESGMGGTPEPLYTPQPLPGFPSPAAMEGELVNRQTGRRMFTEDLLGQPMEVRGRRDPAADLGIRYPYAKAYTQREAVEFERLASTSRISDADRADYEAWLAGKVPETDAERHRREFVYDQIDIFSAAIHGVRSRVNPNRWDITPEEGLAQFEQLIRWIKGEDTFPQNIRTARWENFWTEMKDAKAGQTITEADLADMDRTTRDLYEEWASQLNEMEAATEMSKLKKMLQFNRIWGTGNPDPPKRSAREAMDLWDAFINWGKDRGEYQYHMMDGNVEQMFFQHMDMNHTRRDAVGKVTKRGWETGLEVLALWRALRSSYDLGWHFRQGLIMGANNPRAWAKAWGPAIKSLRNEETATAAEALLRNDPLIRRATTEFWDEPLFIAERGAPWQERDIRAAEQYTSVWAGKIPGIPASERAFTVAGNLTRMQALIDIATRWESVGPGNRVTRVIDNFFGVGEDGRGTPMTDDELHDVI